MKDKFVYYKELGFSSKTEDKQHILLWDIDQPGLKWTFYRAMNKIQYNYYLSDIYIFKTRKGHHAICLSKLDFNMVVDIKKHSNFSDNLHDKISTERGYWVLRVGDDIKCIYIFKSNSTRDKSNAHRRFLSIYYNLVIPYDKYFDKCSILTLEKYTRRKEEKEFKELLSNGQIYNL